LFQICRLDAKFAEELRDLIVRHADHNPGAKTPPAELYLHHPAMEGGRNALCAFDYDGRMRAFAPLFAVPAAETAPREAPNHIWTAITVDPDLEDRHSVREALFAELYNRACEIGKTLGDRKTRLASDLCESLREEIEYLLSKGFEHYQSVFLMWRDCKQPIPNLPLPSGVHIRRSRVETLREQQQYVEAHDLVFNTSPMTLGGLQCFLQSEEWSSGTIVSAFSSDGQLIGGVTAFANESENRRTGRRAGLTEDVFVVPEWRGKGVARRLVAEALLFLQESGIEEAHLEVRATNETALKLYLGLGYQIAREELLLGMFL
jgi:GNAT superfamily N-acetyltransferase